MFRVQINENNCCGCGACYNVCPKDAITMKPDTKGFAYPDINDDLCINCGLCNKVCPIIESSISGQDGFDQEIYGIYSCDNKTRMSSTSGGAFTLFANEILGCDGVVVGASLDKNMDVYHISIEGKEDIGLLQGSKYVQSDTKRIYSEIKEMLLKGKKVLFCGTPCQTDGLLKFIPKNLKENLFTVDFICHGVPSHKIWKEYVSHLENVFHKKIKSYKFRSKVAGWHNNVEVVEFENGKKAYNKKDIDIFGHLFHKNLSLRPYCYNCQYTKYQRVSDVTIGDFWGVEKTYPSMDDNKGTSLVMLNTKKGKTLFEKIQNNAKVIRIDKEQCKQRALYRKPECKYDRDIFWKEYEEKGFSYIAKKYCRTSNQRLIKVSILIGLNKLGLLKYIYKIMQK